MGDTAAAFWVIAHTIRDMGGESRLHVRYVDAVRTSPPPPAVVRPEPWAALIGQYTDWDADTMMRIIRCESNFDENAVSPDGRNVGAFQLNTVHGFSYEDATNPVVSTALAHDVWLSQGYAAWSCY